MTLRDKPARREARGRYRALVTDGAFEECTGELPFRAAPPPTPERMTAILAISPQRSDETIRKISLVKGDDRLAPIVMAMTVEGT